MSCQMCLTDVFFTSFPKCILYDLLSWVNYIPSLPKRAVIVLDNAAFHKKDACLDAIRDQGYEVLFTSIQSGFKPYWEKMGTGESLA
jgi:hypothetical protein